MKELSPETRRILELARDEDEPAPGAAARLERSLKQRILLSAAIVGGGAVLSKPAVGAGLLVTAIKSMAIAGVGASVALLGWEVLLNTAEPRPGLEQRAPNVGRSTSPARLRVEPRAPLPPESTPGVAATGHVVSRVEPADASQPPSQLGETRVVPRVASPAPLGPFQPEASQLPSQPMPPALRAERERMEPDRLAEEAGELREAQRALRSGDSNRALALLEQQQTLYPNGSLAQERSAAKVLALCQAGRAEQARLEAQRFEQLFPNSPLLGRVRGACGR